MPVEPVDMAVLVDTVEPVDTAELHSAMQTACRLPVDYLQSAHQEIRKVF